MTQAQTMDQLDEDELIDQPTDTDVLCGKTKLCMSHPGSKAFRNVIEKYATRYDEADSKYRKMGITKEIYGDLRRNSNSRFLKFNAKRHGWNELTESQVRDKIGHALRFVLKTRQKRDRKCHRRNFSSSSIVTNSSSEDPSASDSSDGEMEERDELPTDSANNWETLSKPTPLTYQTSLGMVPLDHSNTSAMQQTPYTSIIDYFRSGHDQHIPSTKLHSSSSPRCTDFPLRTVSSSSAEDDLWKEDKKILAPAADDLLQMMQEPLIELEAQPVKVYATYEEV